VREQETHLNLHEHDDDELSCALTYSNLSLTLLYQTQRGWIT